MTSPKRPTTRRKAPTKASPAPKPDIWYVIEQAVHQLARAEGAEDRARALSVLRHSLNTARKAEGPTPEILARLEALEAEAAALYERVKDRSVRQAVRGLGSLRMALAAQEQPPAELIDVAITMASEDGGAVVGTMKAPAGRVAKWPKDPDGTPTILLSFSKPGMVEPEDEGGMR